MHHPTAAYRWGLFIGTLRPASLSVRTAPKRASMLFIHIALLRIASTVPQNIYLPGHLTGRGTKQQAVPGLPVAVRLKTLGTPSGSYTTCFQHSCGHNWLLALYLPCSSRFPMFHTAPSGRLRHGHRWPGQLLLSQQCDANHLQCKEPPCAASNRKGEEVGSPLFGGKRRTERLAVTLRGFRHEMAIWP